jgi:hypothetical protein
MNWSGTVKLRASASISCPIASKCLHAEYSGNHIFTVEQTAQTPLLLSEERDIRSHLQAQLDTIVAKFLEAHK